MLKPTTSWKTLYPRAHAGILVMRDVANPAQHEELSQRKKNLEEALRAEFAGRTRAEMASDPVLAAYMAYYRGFGKTYHILLQLESIVLKGKSIPNASVLVEAMFMAELQDRMLTAGHDLESIRLPLVLDAARGEETYSLLGGGEQTCKAKDMLIRDGEGVLSSILYGPDVRTQIRPETRNVVFTTYAPVGVGEDAVRRHLENIRRNVECAVPAGKVELQQVVGEE